MDLKNNWDKPRQKSDKKLKNFLKLKQRKSDWSCPAIELDNINAPDTIVSQETKKEADIEECVLSWRNIPVMPLVIINILLSGRKKLKKGNCVHRIGAWRNNNQINAQAYGKSTHASLFQVNYKIKKPPFRVVLLLKVHLAILALGLPSTAFAEDGLNFWVRDGIRCFPVSINTPNSLFRQFYNRTR